MKIVVHANRFKLCLFPVCYWRLGLSCLALLLFAAGGAFAEPSQRLLSDFADDTLSGWEGKSFEGETDYRIVDDATGKVLRAESHGTASGLAYTIEYEPAEYPFISWRWKISNVIAKGDSRTKSGDDYAARVYVLFPHWFFPKTKTLNYIWANQLPKEAIQKNAFTSNAMMIAVESGAGKVGEWVSVRRNIVEDYRRAFGAEPPQVGAVAIMTDTDNTGEAATAWYDDFVISKE